ncbi:hypothetical protein [Peterkaempfera sp. SMS 1(5)a]|uniref:hypothetical protein n=1 Tax=Peterkaempfera podocarpi TaxID=3232308 RepID=UPI0036708BDD
MRVPDDDTGPGAAGFPRRTRPVFVDASGRRGRLVRRLGGLLAVLGAGYLALLLSTVLGGPTLQVPLLPASQPSHHPAPVGAVPSLRPAPGTHPPANGDGTPGRAGAGVTPAGRPQAPAAAASPSAATPAATVGSTTAPASAPTASAAPSTAKGHGNSGAAPGASHRPTSHP